MSPKQEIYLAHNSASRHAERDGSSIPESATEFEFATAELSLIEKQCERIERILALALDAETEV